MTKIEIEQKKDRQVLKVGNVPILDFANASLGLNYGKGIIVIFDQDCHPALIGYVLYSIYACAWIAMAKQGEPQAVIVKSWLAVYQSGEAIAI